MERYIREDMRKKILLVCGASFDRTEVGRHLQNWAVVQGVELVRFSGFQPDPDFASVVQGVELFRQEGCRSVIAAGGGSAIDVAKCIRLYASTQSVDLDRPAVPNDVKLLAIPTTAGSGSEATHFAAVYRQGVKRSVDCGRPDAVLLDPSTLDTLPDYQRKATLLDALCHGIESFWSVNSTEISRDRSKEAIQGVLANWEGYLQNIPEGNRGMLWTAHRAGQAIDIAQTTAGHAMSYQLTKRYGLAHGHAAALCAARLWPWMLDHLDQCSDPRGKEYLERTLAELAEAMGCTSPRESAERFQTMLDRLELSIPTAAESDLAALASSVDPARLKNFPVSLGIMEIRSLYREILGG